MERDPREPHPRAARGVIEPIDEPQRTSRSLDAVLAEFERLRPEDGWTCDGGAAVLEDMLERARITNRLRCGQYWYATATARCLAFGDDPEDGGDWRDEHHHWVEIGPYEAPTHLIDPNGELRGEPRAQAFVPGIEERYTPRDDPNSRSNREFLSCSPLWDPELEAFLRVDELTDHYDPGVNAYIETLRR